MESAQRIVKNSFWISIQPLVLNVISLFVIGYIASTLGQNDYGRFVFAFSFIALFMPLGNLGLRAVTVRDIATNRDRASEILGKIFVLRMFLASFAFILLVAIINLLDYPPSTRMIVYIAGILLFPNTAATVLFDGFQAFERMEYMAYANFASGIILTAVSVIALYMGYRLVGLTMVYLFGSFLLLLFAVVFYNKNFFSIKMQIDFAFYWESLKKGIPFFLTGILSILNTKIGVVILSKLKGDAAVGLYGAASNLIDRLIVIPDSIGTAIFPALAILYTASRKEATNLFGRFLNYIVILGFPIAVGTTLFSREIISLIYGTEFVSSAVTLSILAWTLPVFFIGYLIVYFLNAVNLQSKALKVTFISTITNICLNFLLIPHYQENGVALAMLLSSSLYGLFSSYLVYKYLSFKINFYFVLKIVGANIILGTGIVLLRNFNLLVAIIGSGFLYIVSLILLRLINGEDWDIIKKSFAKKIDERLIQSYK